MGDEGGQRPPDTYSIYYTVHLPNTAQPLLVNATVGHIVQELRFRITGELDVLSTADWDNVEWVQPPTLSIRVGNLPNGERVLAEIGNWSDFRHVWGGAVPGRRRVITYEPASGLVPQPILHRFPEPCVLNNLRFDAQFVNPDGTPWVPPAQGNAWSYEKTLAVEVEYVCPRNANAGQVMRNF